MPAPVSSNDFLALVRKSQLIEPAKLDAALADHGDPFVSPSDAARYLADRGYLTGFHVEQLLKGKHRGYFLGKYKLLERIGMGGMGQVFLAEHLSMRRRVAVKVLPPDLAANEFARERFLREARAAGQLDHPNLVRAFDVDSDGDVIFLVMEYIEGVSLHDLIVRFGPLDADRAGYYLWQAANGLAYIEACGLVHRDIKPANLLVDRSGTVKILDLGLVRALGDDNELTRGQGVKILGTADFLAPEQAVDCSAVDIRADLYALGATGYFLLTGQPPFPGDKMAMKLIAHQTKPVPRVADVRPDVPAELSELLVALMAKNPADRPATPATVAAALEKWAYTPPARPSELEIPLSAAAGGAPVSAVISGAMPTRAAAAVHAGPALAAAPGGVAVLIGGPSSGTALGPYSGSAIRLYQPPSGHLIPQFGVPTPPPGMAPTPLPPPTPRPSRSAAMAPPALPAAHTHGLGADLLHGEGSAARLANPFKSPSASGSRAKKAAGWGRRRFSLAAGVLVAVGIAGWSYATYQLTTTTAAPAPAGKTEPRAATAKSPGR